MYKYIKYLKFKAAQLKTLVDIKNYKSQSLLKYYASDERPIQEQEDMLVDDPDLKEPP